MNFGTVEELTWGQISERVRSVKPILADLIDEISPDDSYKLILAKYPFGSTVIQKDIFHLPSKRGHSVPLDWNLYPALEGCNNIPLGIILNGSVELFMTLDERIVPFTFYQPGKVFALWGQLDPEISYQNLQVWSMSAGARTIGMLPKITDAYGHKRLQKALGIKAQLPRNMLDHWGLFVEIYHKICNKEQPWFTEMLFFSKKWVDSIKTDKAWLRLYAFLLQEAWNHSAFWRCHMQFNLIFNKFVSENTKANIKISNKYLDIVKHLTMISLGVLPGFSPAVDEIAGPIRSIQEVYLDVYNLREYFPTIVHPQYFNYYETNDPMYYSLQWQTQLDSGQLPKTPLNVMTDLEEVEALMGQFLSFLKNSTFANIEHTPLATLKNIDYGYYHNIQSHNKIIQPSLNLAHEDSRLITLLGKNCDDRLFCDSAQFFRGCVRIAKKKNIVT